MSEASIFADQKIVHRKPSLALGNYSSVENINLRQSFAPLAFPADVSIWLEE